MGALLRDIRFALRTFRRRPGLVAVILLTAGLGIGASTALFDLVNLILWRPLPGDNDVVRVYMRSPQPFIGPFGYLPLADFETFAESSRSFSLLAGERMEGAVLEDEELGTHALAPSFVTGNYFDVLGLEARAGRLLTPDDDRAGAPPVAVVSHSLWRTLFAPTEAKLNGTVGRSVVINGQGLDIVGIAPMELRGSTAGTETDMWLPMAWGQQLVEGWDATPNRQNTDVIGLLEPGVELAQATDELQNLCRELDRIRELPNLEREITVVPGRLTHALDQRGFLPILKMLGAAVGLLLLLASANVANLLLARTVERTREMSLRMALGTSRGRLVGQLVTESLLLGLASGTAGLLVVLGARRLMSLYDLQSFAREMRFDHRVLLAGLVTCGVSSLLFGLAPAALAIRTDLILNLREGAQGFSRGRLRLLQGLTALQIALATTLMICTALIAGDLWRLRQTGLGFDDRGIVRAQIDLRQWDYTAAESAALTRRLAREVSALPEVTAATRSLILPPVFLDIETRFRLSEDLENDGHRTARLNLIDGRYFETLGLELLSGRAFDERDLDGPGAVIVNSMLAQQLWPGQDALGRTIEVENTAAIEPGPRFTVIGVSQSITQHDLRRSEEPILYFSIDQRPRQIAGLAVRTTADPQTFKATLRQQIAKVDPRIVATTIQTSPERRWDALVAERLQAQSAGMLAVVGLLLSLVGIFGTMSLLVAARRRDLGVRKAVGATGSDLVGWVLSQCSKVALAGVAVGALASLWATHILRSWIESLPAAGPGIYFAVAFSLFVASLAAATLPALRAARLDPTETLRAD